jgi:hypothetical protein
MLNSIHSDLFYASLEGSRETDRFILALSRSPIAISSSETFQNIAEAITLAVQVCQFIGCCSSQRVGDMSAANVCLLLDIPSTPVSLFTKAPRSEQQIFKQRLSFSSSVTHIPLRQKLCHLIYYIMYLFSSSVGVSAQVKGAFATVAPLPCQPWGSGALAQAWLGLVLPAPPLPGRRPSATSSATPRTRSTWTAWLPKTRRSSSTRTTRW